MSSAARVPVEERLFSLVLALLATEAGLTKHEILSTVQGYRQRYRRDGDNANLERQFERDKDDIRDLGVPLETSESPGEAGNNQTLRYRIPKGSYELPADISFSPEETALLTLAAMVWREGSMSGESRRALMKLRALGPAAEPVFGYMPRVRVRDDAFDPLTRALERHQEVRFDYLKPGHAEALTRRVHPLALVQHQGRWHLYAREAESGRTRTFLLRRITGKVSVTGTSFPPAEGDPSAIALAELDALFSRNTAVVRTDAGTDAAVRLGKRGVSTETPGVLELHYTDAEIFADELAGYGPEVLVLAPPELRAAVRDRLERTVADHG